MKKSALLALLLALVFIFCACAKLEGLVSGKPDTTQAPSGGKAGGPASGSKKGDPAPQTDAPPRRTPPPTPIPTPTPTPIVDMVKQSEIDIIDQNNVQNQAMFAYDNGYIYGQIFNSSGKPRLYKTNSNKFVATNTEKGEWVELDAITAKALHVDGDYIYYVGVHNDTTEDGIFRIRTNGKDKQKLSSAHGSIQVKGDYIYYTDIFSYEYVSLQFGQNEACHLYRMQKNGTGVETVIAKPVFFFYVFDEVVLYQDDLDGESLHLYNLTTGEDTKLNNDISFQPIYDGEYVYYAKYNESRFPCGIFRMRLDGTEEEEVTSMPVGISMVMYEDFIYFVSNDEKENVYRVKKSGGEPELVIADNLIDRLQILNGKLKYTVYTKEYEYIKSNTVSELDGSDKKVFKK